MARHPPPVELQRRTSPPSPSPLPSSCTAAALRVLVEAASAAIEARPKQIVADHTVSNKHTTRRGIFSAVQFVQRHLHACRFEWVHPLCWSPPSVIPKQGHARTDRDIGREPLSRFSDSGQGLITKDDPCAAAGGSGGGGSAAALSMLCCDTAKRGAVRMDGAAEPMLESGGSTGTGRVWRKQFHSGPAAAMAARSNLLSL
mmetsp:Transcript_18470/g.39992  ORF Transcript_18470/g.39992 Transcript_18470/m.39992 type:complete len:201 (-) Transcript_18470:31-633(-)